MADQKIRIQIEASSNVEAIKQTEQALRNLKREAKDLSSAGLTNTGAGLATPPPGLTKPAKEAEPLFEVFDENQRKAIASEIEALKEFKKVLPETSDEIGDLDRRIAGLEASLKSAGAQTLAEIKALEAMAATKKAAGHSTTELDAKILRLRASLGQKMPTFGQQLKGEVRDLGREFPIFGRGIELFQRATTGAIGRVTAVLVGMTAAFKAAVPAVREFASQEKEFAKLDTALARTGQLTEQYRERLHALAIGLETTSGIVRTEWLGALGQLVQMGMPVDEVDKYAAALENAAGLMDGNLSRAANAVGKAMGGNFDIFREAGILIDGTLPKHERLARLFEELAIRGGGQLESFSKTLGGVWQQLTTATKNFGAAIGSLIDRFTPLRSVLAQGTTILGFWANMLRRTQDVVPGLENALKQTTKSMGDNAEAAERERKAMEALNDELQATSDHYSRLSQQQQALHRIRMDELRLQQELAVKRIETSDLPESIKKARVAQVRGTFDRAMHEETQRAMQEEVQTINAHLEATREQAEEVDRLVDKEKKRLEQEREYNRFLEREKKLLDQINAIDQARSLLIEDGGRGLLPEDASDALKALAFFSTATPHGAVDPEALAEAERNRPAVEDQLLKLHRDKQDFEEKAVISLGKLKEVQKETHENLDQLEKEAAKQLPILSEQIQANARMFKTRQQIASVDARHEIKMAKAAEAQAARDAKADLLENQARALRERGIVPAGELQQIAALRAQNIRDDRNLTPEVKAMRLRDLAEDTEQSIGDDVKSLRTDRMPKISSGISGLKAILEDQTSSVDQLIQINSDLRQRVNNQQQQINQLKMQRRYDLNP